jgi:hypothetical protein
MTPTVDPTCAGCGVDVRPGPGPQSRRWCSGRCRVAYLYRETSYGADQRARYVPTAGTSILLACRAGHVFSYILKPSGRRPKWCDEHRPAWRSRPAEQRQPHVLRTVECGHCRAPFETLYADQRYCSPRCKSRSQTRDPSNRIFPAFKPRDRIRIAERDAWLCGICHEAIDPARRWPDPGSLSIDHVDPDGPHDPSNWQAAHLRCNTVKGRRKVAA